MNIPKIQCTLVTDKNKRLKQLVKEHGDQWFVLTPIQNVQCFDGGQGVKVVSSDGRHERWVRYPEEIRF